MPHVRRDADGRIVALQTEAAEGFEPLPATHPDVLAFLVSIDPRSAYNALDLDFIRVTEDLVYTLIDRGVIQFTDLPAPAQRKLNARTSFRGRKLANALDLIGNEIAM